MPGLCGYDSAPNLRTPNARSRATRSGSGCRYATGHARPASRPSSKYFQTLSRTLGGMKCACTSTRPGSPISFQNATTASTSASVPGSTAPAAVLRSLPIADNVSPCSGSGTRRPGGLPPEN